MNLQQRIDAFKLLGQKIQNGFSAKIPYSLIKAKNAWFTKENIDLALSSISKSMLNEANLKGWLSDYSISNKEKAVAVILAGNIPAVGFHDVLCILAVGYKAQIKVSSKDPILIPLLLNELVEIEPQFKKHIEIVDSLKSFDAVIATGSNNTSIYFNHYFEKYPHIIRRNRKSLGIIYKDSTKEDIRNMSIDIFQYFGLGCRNVSKVFIERGVELEALMEVWHENKELVLHSKYKNNFDYNYTIMLLNQDDFLMNGALLMKRDSSIHSRIATLHFEEFDNIEDIRFEISKDFENIQCIVSQKEIDGFDVVEPGHAQNPSLTQYADHIDTVQFLIDL